MQWLLILALRLQLSFWFSVSFFHYTIKLVACQPLFYGFCFLKRSTFKRANRCALYHYFHDKTTVLQFRNFDHFHFISFRSDSVAFIKHLPWYTVAGAYFSVPCIGLPHIPHFIVVSFFIIVVLYHRSNCLSTPIVGNNCFHHCHSTHGQLCASLLS